VRAEMVRGRLEGRLLMTECRREKEIRKSKRFGSTKRRLKIWVARSGLLLVLLLGSTDAYRLGWKSFSKR
jgi:hypothetical protein